MRGFALLLLAACGSTRAEPARCTALDPGMDFGKASFSSDPALDRGLRASAEAARDLDALVLRLQSDVTNACRNIAIDLGEPASPNGDWCTKARARIVASGAQVTASVNARVETSIQDVLDCEARCDPTAACDPMQSPPSCIGGSLFIGCPSSCHLDHGFECDEGACLGICTGTCDGMPIDAASCAGLCEGTCTDACKPPPGSTLVKCAAHCDGPYSFLTCSNGRLVDNCKRSPLCQAACGADGTARADAHVMALRLTFGGASPPAILRETLERNLPAILLAAQQDTVVANAFVALGQALTDAAARPLDPLGGACTTAISNEFSDINRTLAGVENATATLALGM